MSPDLALIGQARAGKDSTAEYLVAHHGYVRVAFADALKQMAYDTNPIIFFENEGRPVHLRTVVAEIGWERVKDEYPEARSILQNLGVAARNQDEDHWLKIGMRKAYDAFADGSPVVFTDVRFHNEHVALQANSFRTVKILRPGLSADSHVSETELSSVWTDDVIVNDGTLPQLHHKVDAILNRTA